MTLYQSLAPEYEMEKGTMYENQRIIRFWQLFIMANLLLISACGDDSSIIEPEVEINMSAERTLLTDINFPDASLKACIDDIGAEYVDQITSLVCHGDSRNSIEDTTGIGDLVELVELELVDHQFVDLDLSRLSKLSILKLNYI